MAGALCVLSRHGERFAWVVKKKIILSDFFNPAIKAVRVGDSFTSDGNLFQSSIVLMKKEFENGFCFGLNGSEILRDAPCSTVRSTQHINREGHLSINCFVEHAKPNYFAAFMQAIPT